MSEITPIRLIPKIKIEYRIDYKEERGYLNIWLKNGDWSIGYEFKTLSYLLWGPGYKCIDINLDISNEAQKIIYKKDEKTGEYSIKKVVDWLVDDIGVGLNIVTHPIEEIEITEELIEPKATKLIKKLNVTLEYYDKSKILKIPYFNDEIRINIENENLEYIRNNKKIIKAFPLNKEIHFYGIKPETYKVDRIY
jgi:hypothetical protein